MTTKKIENLPNKKENKPQTREKERKFTDEEISQLNEMVAAAVRILRSKEISINHPEFQEYKKEAINIVFGERNIISRQDQNRMWPSLARRIELTMAIPPEEHFHKKRLKELKTSLGEPKDERTRELVNIVIENISTATKGRKVTAKIIRDSVYKTLSQIRYPNSRSKEAEAKVLKYYLCVRYGISTSDPDLRSVSDPSRQKDLF
jgi:hypothetical protein